MVNEITIHSIISYICIWSLRVIITAIMNALDDNKADDGGDDNDDGDDVGDDNDYDGGSGDDNNNDDDNYCTDNDGKEEGTEWGQAKGDRRLY